MKVSYVVSYTLGMHLFLQQNCFVAHQNQSFTSCVKECKQKGNLELVFTSCIEKQSTKKNESNSIYYNTLQTNMTNNCDDNFIKSGSYV